MNKDFQNDRMKNMLVVGVQKLRCIQRKHIEFNPAKHTVIMGDLCHKATFKPIGRIIRCYSLPEASDTLAATEACMAGNPPHTLQLTD